MSRVDDIYFYDDFWIELVEQVNSEAEKTYFRQEIVCMLKPGLTVNEHKKMAETKKCPSKSKCAN